MAGKESSDESMQEENMGERGGGCPVCYPCLGGYRDF